jgi:acyl carrier protein
MDKMAEINRRIQQIVCEQLKHVKPEQVVPTAALAADLHADPLGVVEVILAIEDAFSVDMDEDDAQKIVTVGDAIQYIASHT